MYHAYRYWCLIFLLCGCSFLPKRKLVETPTLTTPDVQLRGDAKVPAKVDTKNTTTNLPLPEGSRFVFDQTLNTMTLTLSKASTLTAQQTVTAVQGPTAFEPEKGPTVGEISTAKAEYWTYVGLMAGLAVGGAAALFGLVRDWDMVMYGGACVAAACAFGLFVHRNPVILVFIGLGVAAAVVGPLLWHTKIKPLQVNGTTTTTLSPRIADDRS